MTRRGARFVRFYPSDWRSGCIGMTLEEQGLYVAICAYIYETGKRVPLANAAAAKILMVQVQKYAKVIQSLIAAGKVTTHEDGHTVERAERELLKAQGTAAVDAAGSETSVERRSDQGRQGSPRPHPLEQPPQSPPNQPTGGEAEKTQSFLRATKEPITNNQTDKSDMLVSASPELKAAFNGSTEIMLDDIARWMGSERQYAEKWLRSLMSAHGAAKVMDGYRSVVGAQAKGRVVADPIRYFAKVTAASKATTERADKPMVPAHVVRYAKPKLELQPWEVADATNHEH